MRRGESGRSVAALALCTILVRCVASVHHRSSRFARLQLDYPPNGTPVHETAQLGVKV